jgi:hypothetical protein
MTLKRAAIRAVAVSCCVATAVICGYVQNGVAQAPAAGADSPVFTEFKGVQIGMSCDEARKKLGNPSEKGDEQDFYSLAENNTAQIYYDKEKKVYAVSISFLGGANVPTAKSVLGSDLETKPDGSMYKLIRYPKVGYWVSYSKTPGDDPLITITMQKIVH